MGRDPLSMPSYSRSRWSCRFVGAVLASCGFLSSGCGGNVVGNGPGDASGGSVETSVDSGKGDSSHGDAMMNVDANACRPVLASDYDQSCTVDTDCVTVGEVSSCPADCYIACALWTISKKVAPQYMTALSLAAAGTSPPACFCPAEGLPCCRSGSCTTTCSSRTDALPACADAGGYCIVQAGCGSGMEGPSGACAYSDETCCLN